RSEGRPERAEVDARLRGLTAVSAELRARTIRSGELPSAALRNDAVHAARAGGPPRDARRAFGRSRGRERAGDDAAALLEDLVAREERARDRERRHRARHARRSLVLLRGAEEVGADRAEQAHAAADEGGPLEHL